MAKRAGVPASRDKGTAARPLVALEHPGPPGLDELLERGREHGYVLQEDIDALFEEDAEAAPEQRLISRETLSHAVRAMRRLPEGQRQVIALRDMHGCSSDEVCTALGITGGNQRVQLHRARAKVRRELEAYFSTAALGT
jgi:RNA polymerase sigma factor (sigma-70 family)